MVPYKLLLILLLGMLPVSEIRGAIVYGLASGVSPLTAYAVGLLGNILVVLPLLWFLEYFSTALSRKSYYFNRFFAWLFERTRRNSEKHFAKWGRLGLALFVAVPLPMTGAWTAAIAAFIFGFPRFQSFLLISLGAAVSGLIMVAIVSGFLAFLKF